MSENPFQAKVAALLAGEIPELVVEQAEFMIFRDVWINHPQRKEIVGEAGLNGRIRYKFLKKATKSEN